jgi:hypothetical protein
MKISTALNSAIITVGLIAISILCLQLPTSQAHAATPDIQVSMLTVDPTSALQGSAVSIGLRVNNVVALPTGEFTTRLYLSNDATITTADTYLGQEMVASLNGIGSSETASIPVIIPADASPGARYIGAIADYNNVVAESSEINNTRLANIIVLALKCFGISALNSGVCGDHGICVDTDTCDCQIGYGGDECAPICGGHCVNCDAPETCSACADGWTGMPACTEAVCTTTCGDNATCTGPDVCECNSGYSGDGFICEEIIDCTGMEDWFACLHGACFSGICEPIGENNRCEDAIELSPGPTQLGDLDGFKPFETVPSGCVGHNLSGPDAFYTLTIPAGRTYRIEVTPHASLKVAMVIWEDCTLSDKYCVTGGGDGTAGTKETLELTAASETTYIIQVLATNADSGASSLSFAIEVEDVTTTGSDESNPGEDIAGDDVNGSDTAQPTDLGGADTGTVEETGTSGGGCGQGNSPSSLVIALLLLVFVAIRRLRAQS